jgi:large subunit ribosomal protein L17
MRHYKKGRKLGTDASHTKAMKKNLVVNLFTNDRIKTTLERAKEIRGDVDRVVTWAKRGDVHSRRLAIAKLGNKDLVAEIFSKVEQGMFQGRPGGYSRILRLGTRRGDSATIVIMELVQEPLTKKADKGATGAGADKKPSARKSLASRLRGKPKDEDAADKAAAEDVAEDENEAEAEAEAEATEDVVTDEDTATGDVAAEDATDEDAEADDDATTDGGAENEAIEATAEDAVEGEAAEKAVAEDAAAEDAAAETTPAENDDTTDAETKEEKAIETSAVDAETNK